MPLEETQHRIEYRGIAGPSTQVTGRNTGQCDKSLSASVIGQNPGKRLERQNFGGVVSGSDFAYRHGNGSYFFRGDRKRVARKVLVVEDNELNLRLFCDLLRAHDCAVEGVRDGREALDTARSFEPDLIVMDIQMPHVTGIELIEEIRADEDLRPIPVMAVTAYAGKADEERARTAGADAYVSKPISLMRFVEVVEELLKPGPEPVSEAESASL